MIRKIMFLVIVVLSMSYSQAYADGSVIYGCHSYNFLGRLACSLTGINSGYKQEYGGYTMTNHGYRPLKEVGGSYKYKHGRPGYTNSKSIYWDQRPEVFGIIPDPNRQHQSWQYIR